jgi:peptidoglycan/LPS O-acetylase OafA/YrhL
MTTIEAPYVIRRSGAEPRKDIQVLRGIAVLQVVFYHAGPSYLAAGYLGVDVFFVISGYLVARMVLDRIESGHWSFREFYLRRARRLLPASSCTLLACALLSTIWLAPSDRGDFIKQLLGAMTFSGNIVLWKQSGYFDTTATLKPLLHMWSLSLEEQYYLALPALLVVLPRRWRLTGTGIACLVSGALCLFVVENSPVATFYLLPTRAWELLLGCLCSIYCRRHEAKPPKILLTVSLLLVLLVPVIHPDPVHPRLDALLVTAATAVLLIGRFTVLERAPLTGGLARVGDWSYSLYLVHWPLFAFAINAYAGGALPVPLRLMLVVTAFGLAYLQYRFVERRFESASTSAARLLVAVSGVCAISVLVAWGHPFAARAGTPTRDYVWTRRANYGMNEACVVAGTFIERPSCMTATSPEVAVWGDSFAMHLVPGLLTSGVGKSLIQMTRSGCSPVLDLVIAGRGVDGYRRRWAEDCVEFNHSVYAYLGAKRSIRYVVMSSPFDYNRAGTRFYQRETGFTRVDERLLLDRYAATVRALRAVGKNVVVVAPPPSLGNAGFNIGLCLERVETHSPLFGRSSCDFAEREYLAANARSISFLRTLERAADVAILWPSDSLCSAGICRATIEGKFMYRDGGHLSHEGSIEFQKIFSLDEKIVRHAR